MNRLIQETPDVVYMLFCCNTMSSAFGLLFVSIERTLSMYCYQHVFAITW